ncbi:hypothetical protein KIPB_006954 [Kipferlia bialata]|uniref:Uncharacterized protein n=1 Tax=Kipferlia bialata TaxID=797122 RepID=A0A9K3CZB4_9EUKA|nr:hypothetical protein KIPB_006954 [Kipferlia bialata]|eukprot:g6954.t1
MSTPGVPVGLLGMVQHDESESEGSVSDAGDSEGESEGEDHAGSDTCSETDPEEASPASEEEAPEGEADAYQSEESAGSEMYPEASDPVLSESPPPCALSPSKLRARAAAQGRALSWQGSGRGPSMSMQREAEGYESSAIQGVDSTLLGSGHADTDGQGEGGRGGSVSGGVDVSLAGVYSEEEASVPDPFEPLHDLCVRVCDVCSHLLGDMQLDPFTLDVLEELPSLLNALNATGYRRYFGDEAVVGPVDGQSMSMRHGTHTEDEVLDFTEDNNNSKDGPPAWPPAWIGDMGVGDGGVVDLTRASPEGPGWGDPSVLGAVSPAERIVVVKEMIVVHHPMPPPLAVSEGLSLPKSTVGSEGHTPVTHPETRSGDRGTDTVTTPKAPPQTSDRAPSEDEAHPVSVEAVKRTEAIDLGDEGSESERTDDESSDSVRIQESLLMSLVPCGASVLALCQGWMPVMTVAPAEAGRVMGKVADSVQPLAECLSSIDPSYTVPVAMDCEGEGEGEGEAPVDTGDGDAGSGDTDLCPSTVGESLLEATLPVSIRDMMVRHSIDSIPVSRVRYTARTGTRGKTRQGHPRAGISAKRRRSRWSTNPWIDAGLGVKGLKLTKAELRELEDFVVVSTE